MGARVRARPPAGHLRKAAGTGGDRLRELQHLAGLPPEADVVGCHAFPFRMRRDTRRARAAGDGVRGPARAGHVAAPPVHRGHVRRDSRPEGALQSKRSFPRRTRGHQRSMHVQRFPFPGVSPRPRFPCRSQLPRDVAEDRRRSRAADPGGDRGTGPRHQGAVPRFPHRPPLPANPVVPGIREPAVETRRRCGPAARSDQRAHGRSRAAR